MVQVTETREWEEHVARLWLGKARAFRNSVAAESSQIDVGIDLAVRPIERRLRNKPTLRPGSCCFG
jgi:hypothetical protein